MSDLSDLSDMSGPPGGAPAARAWLRAALLALAVAGFAARVWVVSEKRALTYDEPWSLLHAAGKIVSYQEVVAARRPPYGVWARPADWLALIRPDGWRPGQVWRGAFSFDAHPPLCWLLLHAWHNAVTPGLRSAALLNAPLALAGGLLVFGMARALLSRAEDALLAAVMWLWCPGTFLPMQEARPYWLLGAFVLAFALSCIRVAAEGGVAAFAALGATALGGMLSHYHFAFCAVGPALFAVVALARRRAWRRAAAMVGVILLSAVVFFIVLPPLSLQFALAAQYGRTMPAEGAPARLRLAVRVVAGFILPIRAVGDPPARTLIGLLAVAGLASVAYALRTPCLRRTALFCLSGMAGAWGLVAGANVAGVMQPLTIEPKHLMAGAPFFFVLLASLGGAAAGRRATLWRAGLCGLLVVSGAVSLARIYLEGVAFDHAMSASAVARGADVIVEGTMPGHVIPSAWFLMPDSRMLVAELPDLEPRAGEWVEARDARPRVLIYGGADDGRRERFHGRLSGLGWRPTDGEPWATGWRMALPSAVE